MPVKKRNELYDLFATGNKPTHDDFVDLIDSAINIAEDGIGVSEKGKPMEIIQQGEKRRLLDFSSSKDTPIWRISALASTGLRSGLNIVSSNTSRLFIDQGSGLIGFNTENPEARLHIVPESGTALRVDDTLKNPSLAIEAGGNIGIGTLAEEDYKVAINGKVHIQNNTTIDEQLRVKNGLTVEGALFTAGQGMTVRNGATIETGLLTVKAGLTITSGLLSATDGAVVSGSTLEAQKGLTVQNGATIQSGKLEANAGLKVSGAALEVNTGATISGTLTVQNKLTAQNGAEIQTAKLEAKAGATVSGALLEANNGLTVHGTTTLYNAASIESGILTAKGGLSVVNGSFFTADGEVTLGNEDTGKVTILGALTVNKGLTVSQGLVASGGATVNGLTVTNGVTVNTGMLKANGGLSASGSVTLNPTSVVTINGDITVTGGAQIDENLNITGELSVTGDATFGNVSSQTLTVDDITISGTLDLGSVDSVELQSINADSATIKNLTVSTLCRTVENVVFDSSVIYAVYQGPTTATPKIKVQRGTFPPKVLTPPGGEPVEEIGHYLISVDEVTKTVTITYDDLSDISEMPEDWELYKLENPEKAEGFYFAWTGTSSWRPQDMELELFNTQIPYKEYTFTDKGLRIVYTGEKPGAPQFEIKGTNVAPPMFGFTFWFEINGLKLTITYPNTSDPATLTLTNLITDWQNWKTLGMANVGEFDIQRTSATEALVTDFSETLAENQTGYVSFHGMIKTKTATVVGALKFDGFPVVINGISQRDSLAENSNALLVTQKAVKTYTDRGLAAKADQSYVDTELGKKANLTYVNGELAKKANLTYVDGELVKKAALTYVDGELAKKAALTYVDGELAKKAALTYVDGELAKKADQTYVNDELAKKADQTFVETELAKKANLITVNSALAKKADLTVMDAALAAKAGLQKLAVLPILAKTTDTVDDISLAAGSRGLLMVLIKKTSDGSILGTGIFAIHDTDTVTKISGEGMTDQPDGGNYNVYYAATKLTVQNTTADNITVTVTYFGA
jgi:predicted acyltransferase (DUF342 family)